MQYSNENLITESFPVIYHYFENQIFQVISWLLDYNILLVFLSYFFWHLNTYFEK